MNDENIILDFISVSFVHRNLSEYYIGIYAALRNYYRQQSGVYKKYYSGKLKKDICYDTLEEDADEASHDEPVNKYAKKNKQGLKENIAQVCLSKYKKVILPHGGGLPKKKKKKHPEGYWEKNLYVIGVKLLHVSYEYNNKVLLIIT
ncbi:hypothetical protein PFMG_04948 [Plasmodium falciparum IGH-CR14]|uniref:Uncharacterized protein n=1 Tax=Plasmodium falciparum IGH-CR14 TaxID=580059 RepID=A0A0L1IHR5_PLAFA|nr:hypothetical protein PFMG_04948 [Plasmodium falciparum IGH-CR14]